MNRCMACDYYDPSVDACNADDVCYADGYDKGQAEAIDRCLKALCEHCSKYNEEEKCDKHFCGTYKAIEEAK